MTSTLNQYLEKALDSSKTELESIEGYFVKKILPKKTVLLHQGDVCKFEGFVEKGCIKTYFIDKDGFEVILNFATENWWIGDLASFETKSPSKMFIETIEDSVVYMIDPDTKIELLAKHQKMEKMYRLLIQRHLIGYQERLFENIALAADQRYDNFLKRYPALPQRIPQHLIAAYLGISPEFLSRLRKRKSIS